ncbi:MAG TPA: PEP-CTERM sorting domain-containing protein [Burkholderiaceae bacterium]
MKFNKIMLAAATLVTAFGAQAQVTGSLGGGYGTFLELSDAGLSGGSVATLSGGTVYTADQPFADIPFGVIFGGDFLAAGPIAGTPATLTFAGTGLDYISFLWGSPDTYNRLTVTSTGGAVQSFDVGTLGFLTTNGDQNTSQYVQFMADAGVKITALTFYNAPQQDAFESANFTVTAPVPEPSTYALLLAGIGAIGYVARRRRAT